MAGADHSTSTPEAPDSPPAAVGETVPTVLLEEDCGQTGCSSSVLQTRLKENGQEMMDGGGAGKNSPPSRPAVESLYLGGWKVQLEVTSGETGTECPAVGRGGTRSCLITQIQADVLIPEAEI